MLATLADNGTYHSPHIVQYWQASGPGQAKQMSKVTTRQVLTAQQAGDVQYAMEMTNIDGTAAATATFGQNAVGTVISKTGTTSSEKSGFFIGATSQYALAVGMFTKTPASPDNLAELGGGGFGGFWPAKVWNAMAGQTFNTQPQTFPTTPDTTGQQQWNLIGQVNLNCNQQNGKHGKNNNPFANLFGGSNQNCPTASPSATPGATNNQFNLNGQNGNAATTGPQTGTVTCDPTVDQSCTQNADGTFTCDPTTDVDCTVTGTAAATTPAANAGNGGANNGQPVNAPATAGGVLFLPGTLLLGGSSLRRRRKNRRNRAQ
jgi:membrane peptidoglycan carboxypeptidase